MPESTEEPLWMGIDLGTQSARVVVADSHGRELAAGAATLHSVRSSGRRHEQDPRQWWRAIGTAARRARAGLPGRTQAARVGALAICSTSGTVLLTDAGGDPITPALMYDDARASDELVVLTSAAQANGRYGVDVQLSWALPKIAWLLRNGSDRIPAARVAHSADFVAACLVGHPVRTDSSHALKSGYDVVEERWDDVLMSAAGIEPAVLPHVVRPGTVLGSVTPSASEHTGIPAGTAVVAGMTDGCAAQIAAGALARGAWNSVLGTTLVLKGVSDELLIDRQGAVYSHRHPDGGWLPGGASNVGAGILSREFPGQDLDALADEARSFEPAAGVIYPLTARGERFPFVRPDAVGFEVGSFSGPAERYAAILQGVAYVERLCFEHLDAIGADVTGPITLTGGAVRSAYWTQLRADVLGRPLHLPAIPEPSFGMAVLASARHDSITARAAAMVRIRETIEPRDDGSSRLAPGYERLIAELVRRGYIGRDEEDEMSATPTIDGRRGREADG